LLYLSSFDKIKDIYRAMIKIKIKIIFILTAVFLFGFGLYLAQAAENSLEGYAWSENIGWISFNCSNNNSCAVVDYSVKINEANGKFSGYAWSENLGWIDFSPNPSYPAQPNKSAELDFSTGQTSGWARIVSLKDYSDSGWIKMSGSNYGVVLNSGIFDGFAWSDEIGWIDFSPQYGGIRYSCFCNNWANTGCGVSPCALSEMKQTRDCTPAGCQAQEQCAVSASCLHTECSADRLCVSMPGAGTDECSTDSDCIPQKWLWWEIGP